jgi:hypothetical protein
MPGSGVIGLRFQLRRPSAIQSLMSMKGIGRLPALHATSVATAD